MGLTLGAFVFGPGGLDVGPLLNGTVFNPDADPEVDDLEIGTVPLNIVLLLCLAPGLPLPSPLLFVFKLAEEAKIPGRAPEEDDVGDGSIVVLLCLVPTSTPTLLVTIVVVVVVVITVDVLTGRDVTLNEGVGALCLIGIGAILSSSFTCSRSGSETGDCG
jgi:hypothetical protein